MATMSDRMREPGASAPGDAAPPAAELRHALAEECKRSDALARALEQSRTEEQLLRQQVELLQEELKYYLATDADLRGVLARAIDLADRARRMLSELASRNRAIGREGDST